MFRFFYKPAKEVLKDTGVVLASTAIGGGIYTLGQMTYNFSANQLSFFNDYLGNSSIKSRQQTSDKRLEKSLSNTL
ncbi:hypothetical protein [Legionella fallonii]|uniref:Uncharacterized protein n=1 Tax=Legionella fallonii LLAP-10 TaxID=1212491 RepID=A0A098G8Z3_9GAMM|nr:hypothetical protein [Legionella fallonii]CEG58436.1 protein of unknown function [Legionella fallonii LLAP-10]